MQSRRAFPASGCSGNDENLGFGRAVNRGVEAVETPVVVLVNNDVVCEPDFVERMLEPFSDERVGLVAGVLVQHDAPELVDSAGIELDPTLRSWDRLWNRPLTEVANGSSTLGPCGGAAAYRVAAWREVGGFDDAFFAYWEDVDLALRLRLAGWRSAFAAGARVLHKHSQTLGAASPAQRRLEAFGRGFVLARYRVGRLGLLDEAADRGARLAGARRPPRRQTRDGPDPGAAARAAHRARSSRSAAAGRARRGLVRRGARPAGAPALAPLLRPPAGAFSSDGRARERRPLIDGELRAEPAGRALGEPTGPGQLGVCRPLDRPARGFEQRDQVAPREPADVRAVAMSPRRVAERSADDEVANEREVARVRHADVQEGARRRDGEQPAQHRLGIRQVLEHVVGEDRVERRLEVGELLALTSPTSTSS